MVDIFGKRQYNTHMNKLLNSPGILAILATIALSIWVSQLDFKPVKHKQIPGKPLEEIINSPVKDLPAEPWDKEFRSAIQPSVDK